MQDDDLSIPEFLKREDTPESKASRESLTKALAKNRRAAPPAEVTRAKLTQHDLDVITELTSGAAATKKAKAAARISKLLANKNGDAAKLPLQGKAALEAITGAESLPVASEARTAKRGKQVKPGKKEQALRESRNNNSDLSATVGETLVKGEGAAADQPAAQAEKEKEVKSRKKANGTAANHNARTPVRNGNGKSISAGIIELARRAHGVSLTEVLDYTEKHSVKRWPSISMPQVAKSQGVKLRKEKKKGEATRYFVAA